MNNISERKIFMKYLIPSMLSMMAVSAYSFVDTFVVGQGIGAQAVAAMGLGTPVVSILYALGFLLGAGGAVNYSVALGTGKKEKARSYFSAAFFITILLWIVIAVSGNIFIKELAVFLGATEVNLSLTTEYLRYILSLSGFLIMDLVLNNFMRNEGHPNVSMIATVTGTGLNIVLDFVFVLVFNWGMSGAASATCIASIVSVFINLGNAVFKKTNLIPNFTSKYMKRIKSIIRIGFGSFVLEGAIAVISVVFLNSAQKYYGDNGASAFSVIITLNLVVYSLLNGVAQSIQPLVSQAYAQNEKSKMRKFLKYGLLTSISLGVIFCSIAELFSNWLASLFVKDSDTILNLSAYGLRYFAPAFVFMAVSIIIGIYFQSETKSLPSLIILLGRSAVLPIIVLVLSGYILHENSLWLAIPIGEALAAVIAIILYLSERNKKQ